MKITQTREVDVSARMVLKGDGSVSLRIHAMSPYGEGSKRTATVSRDIEAPKALKDAFVEVVNKVGGEVAQQALNAADQARRVAMDRKEKI